MDKNVEIYAEGYRAMQSSEDFTSTAENLIRVTKVHKVKPISSGRAFDFGCGDGRHVIYLNSMGYNVHGTEVSDDAVEVTERRLGELGIEGNVIKKVDAGSVVPFDDNSFELVLCWETIHWVGDKEQFMFYIDEFKRVLEKSGRIIVTMPTESHYLKEASVEIGESQYRCEAEERSGTVFYSPNLRSLRSIFEDKFGFTIAGIHKYEHGRLPMDGDELQGMSLKNMFSMYAFLLET